MILRRVAGEPLEHLLGRVEFCGLQLAVGPGVFVPRRRTEHLAAVVRELVLASGPGPIVVELCCGVAPIAATLLTVEPPVRLYASDIDPSATDYARRNLGGRATVSTGDLVAALPPDLQGAIDVLAVNTPYVPTAAIAAMPPEARDHEPLLALDGGADGLDVQRRVAALAARWLAPGGHVLVETSEAQAPQSVALFAAHGLRARIEVDEEIDATVVLGMRQS